MCIQPSHPTRDGYRKGRSPSVRVEQHSLSPLLGVVHLHEWKPLTGPPQTRRHCEPADAVRLESAPHTLQPDLIALLDLAHRHLNRVDVPAEAHSLRLAVVDVMEHDRVVV